MAALLAYSSTARWKKKADEHRKRRNRRTKEKALPVERGILPITRARQLYDSRDSREVLQLTPRRSILVMNSISDALYYNYKTIDVDRTIIVDDKVARHNFYFSYIKNISISTLCYQPHLVHNRSNKWTLRYIRYANNFLTFSIKNIIQSH